MGRILGDSIETPYSNPSTANSDRELFATYKGE
jgi:hypothetical protein